MTRSRSADRLAKLSASWYAGDDGCLVEVGELAEDADPVDVEVEFYRSDTQFSVRTVMFSETADAWTVDVVLGARGAGRPADDRGGRGRRGG